MDPPLRERLAGGTRQATGSSARRAGDAWPAAAALLARRSRCALPGRRCSCRGDAAARRRRPARRGRGGAGSWALVLLVVYDRLPLWAFHVGRRCSAPRSPPPPSTPGAPRPPTGRCRTSGSRCSSSTSSPLRAALVHLALMAAGYALALVLEDAGREPVDGWIATVGTLLVTGLFVAVVRDRLDAPDRRPQRRRPPRPAHRAAQPARLRGGVRRRARARPPHRRAAQPDRRRPRPLQARERRARPRRRRRRARRAWPTRSARAKRSFDSAARVGGEEFALLAPDCDEHGAYMLAERVRAEVHEALRDRGDEPAHDQLRHRHLPAPRAVRGGAAARRRPGALRRQAARPQPLGDLERRGARASSRARRAARTARRTWSWRRCSTSPRRSTCATPAARATASASAASPS